MASNKELDRMTLHIEMAITRIHIAIKKLPSPCFNKQEYLDPDTGLRKDLLQLDRQHSRLKNISIELQIRRMSNGT